MIRPRVVVCDDDPDRVGQWARRIQNVVPDHDVLPLSVEQFAAGVRALRERSRLAKEREPFPADAAFEAFDNAQIVVLDSNLTPDQTSQYSDPEAVRKTLSSEMGGELAHLVRSHTTAGVIVVVNEGSPHRTFDLTMVRRLTGVADAYVSVEDLSTAGLWRTEAPSGTEFRPWGWPRLTALATSFADRVADTPLDRPFEEALGLSRGSLSEFALMRQLETLPLEDDGTGGLVAPEDLTLRQLASREPWGLRAKEAASDPFLVRVAVSAARRWAERVLLPAMNVIVDVPHLLQARPWLVQDRANLTAWNDLVASGMDAAAPPQLEQSAFNEVASRLLGRQVWCVPQLTAPRPGDRIESSDPVFCEDTSAFRPIDAARDVMTDLDGAYPRRYVADLEGVRYQPRSRLAL